MERSGKGGRSNSASHAVEAFGRVSNMRESSAQCSNLTGH